MTTAGKGPAPLGRITRTGICSTAPSGALVAMVFAAGESETAVEQAPIRVARSTRLQVRDQ
jgi:hypothetical protein